ncbi:MAG: redoxin family protein [bacterium]|nr:redoxin family protein [bacterium]
MKWMNVAAGAVLGLAVAAPVSAADLGIGDAAPKLEVSQWVKGQPVDLAAAKGKNIVLVEFWATWCGPCVDSVPHLTKLEKHYGNKGVMIVGVTAEDDNNSLEQVEKFVKDQGDRLGYRIAFDKEGQAEKAFMEAAGAEGIPTLFVVDREGRIAWIGHPMDDVDQVLDQILAGTYDLIVARRKYELQRETEMAMFAGDWEGVIQHSDEYLILDPRSVRAYRSKLMVYIMHLEELDKARKTAEQAFTALKDDPGSSAMMAEMLVEEGDTHGFNAMAIEAVTRAAKMAPKDSDVRSAQYVVLASAGKDDEALAVANETIELIKGDPTALGRFARTLGSPDPMHRCNDLALKAVELALAAEPDRAEHLQTKFLILATCKQDHKTAEKVGRYLVEKAADDANLLNGFSWGLLTDESTKGKYNELALIAAQRCHDASGGKNWSYLDTLALAKFENGAVAEAVELEKKAIELCDNEAMKAQLKEVLAGFEATKKQ